MHVFQVSRRRWQMQFYGDSASIVSVNTTGGGVCDPPIARNTSQDTCPQSMMDTKKSTSCINIIDSAFMDALPIKIFFLICSDNHITWKNQCYNLSQFRRDRSIIFISRYFSLTDISPFANNAHPIIFCPRHWHFYRCHLRHPRIISNTNLVP